MTNVIRQHDFIDRGRALARKALAARIRCELEEKYRPQLQRASWIGRLRLRWKIGREVHAEFERLAPRDALYFARW